MNFRMLIAGAAMLAGSATLAADQITPARESFAASCAELATAMGLRDDAHQRFVNECVWARENANQRAPVSPFEPMPGC